MSDPSQSRSLRSRREILCDYCRADIAGTLRIKCAECPDYQSCLSCFSSGVRVHPHLPSHKYVVQARLTTPLFSPDWGADEELALLDAIDAYGLGNWQEISDHLANGKNKFMCEEHYTKIYLESSKAPLPDIDLTNKQKDKDNTNNTNNNNENEKSAKKEKKGDEAQGQGGQGAQAQGGQPLDTKSKSNSKNNLSSGQSNSNSASSTTTGSSSKPKPQVRGLGHLVGWIPNRGDFDQEWDNEAEAIIADMEFSENDNEWEKTLKLSVLEIYNRKLDERAARKKFILERELLERKEKKRTKEEKEVYNNLRVFARFHSPQEHEAFVQGVLNEMRLRKRIHQLQTWRANGIRTLPDGETYEIEKRKREHLAQARNKRLDSDFVSTGKDKKKDKDKGNLTQGLGSNSLASSNNENSSTILNWETSEEAARNAKISKTSENSDISLNPPIIPLNNNNNSSNTHVPVANSSLTLPAENPLASNFNAAALEGGNLLTTSEISVCNMLRMEPTHYLAVKERVIREVKARGLFKPGQARTLIQIDINKSTKVIDFFTRVEVGWPNTAPALINKLQSSGVKLELSS